MIKDHIKDLETIQDDTVGPKCNHKSPYKRKPGEDREEGGHVKVGGRVGVTQAQAKEASSHQRLEEAGRTVPQACSEHNHTAP